MKKIISIGITYLHFSVSIVAALIVFLTVGLLFALFIAQSISISESTISLLNLSFLIILAFITMIYAFSTWQIVDDQRKSRQIAFIERRLEKLYYPIKDVLSNPITIKYSISDIAVEIAWKKVEEIVPFQYLAYEKSKDMINEFIKKVIKSKTEYRDALLFSNFENDELKIIINNDIEMYEKELNELTMK